MKKEKTCMFSLIVCSQGGECIIDGRSPISGVRRTAKEVQRSRADRGSSYFSSGTVRQVIKLLFSLLFVCFYSCFEFQKLTTTENTIRYHNALA